MKYIKFFLQSLLDLFVLLPTIALLMLAKLVINLTVKAIDHRNYWMPWTPDPRAHMFRSQ